MAPRNLLVAASPSGDYQYPWMSAKALATCSFEPATSHKAPEGLAAEIQFREDLWREYRFEAINAGLSPAEAAEYASALSPELGLVARAPGMTPGGRGWYYQSRLRVVERTITSGLITLTRWQNSKTIGRTAGAGASIFTLNFRPWNTGGKS